MISPSDRIYYTDPLINHANRKGATEVLTTRVLHDRGFRSPLGKVLPFTGYFDSQGFMLYTVDGLDVEGQPVSAVDAPVGGDRVILFSDDTDQRFAVGELIRRDVVTGTGTFTNVLFSDATGLPEGMTGLTAAKHVAAAPWARELMPRVGEPDEVTEARVNTAKWLWNKRRAEAVVTVEAYQRGYEDNLENLDDELVGTPGWMWLVTGSVILSDPVPVPEGIEERAEALAKSGIGSRRRPYARPMVPVTLFMNTPADPDSDGPSRETVISNFRAQLGDYTLEVGSWTSTRVLYKIDTTTNAA